MKYCSIDIETSGLNSEKNCVLSIGAYIEDTETKLPRALLPSFNAIILQREICGSPVALTMNRGIIQLMGDYIESSKETKSLLTNGSGYMFLEESEVAEKFFYFLFEHGFGYNLYEGGMDRTVQTINGVTFPLIGTKCKPVLINVAGKNFGTFDKLFLEKLPRWQQLIRIKQRILDPGILFCDWLNDESLPSLTICKERCGIIGEVTHNADDDAWDVIQVLRTRY